jgi:hypothetical protein
MLLYFLNTAVMFPFFPVIGLLKLLPVARWRALCGLVLDRMATLWISVNNLNLKITKRSTGRYGSRRPQPARMVSRNRKPPLPGRHPYFTKGVQSQDPLSQVLSEKGAHLGAAHGHRVVGARFPLHEALLRCFSEKVPAPQGEGHRDHAEACEKFRHIPVSIMNFVEGTRFTHEKHRRQNSPFANLLRPKAGGWPLCCPPWAGII